MGIYNSMFYFSKHRMFFGLESISGGALGV